MPQGNYSTVFCRPIDTQPVMFSLDVFPRPSSPIRCLYIYISTANQRSQRYDITGRVLLIVEISSLCAVHSSMKDAAKRVAVVKR